MVIGSTKKRDRTEKSLRNKQAHYITISLMLRYRNRRIQKKIQDQIPREQNLESEVRLNREYAGFVLGLACAAQIAFVFAIKLLEKTKKLYAWPAV